MLYNQKDIDHGSIEILINNYRLSGFDVKIQDNFIVLNKHGLPEKKIRISTAIKMLNSIHVEST